MTVRPRALSRKSKVAAEFVAVADHLEHLIAEADPQKAKPLLRLLIEELRVNGRAEILPTYRLVTPVVCAMSEKSGRNQTLRKPGFPSRPS